MSIPLPRFSRTLRRIPAAGVARGVSVAMVVLALVGFAVVGPLQQQGAGAAVPSSLTVKWVNDTSTAASSQPTRDPSSPHYAEFKNISVTVNQTTGIIDQAITVNVSGFAAGTVASTDFGANAQNFVQAMQCWGPNPRAADFRETCEWGGRNTPGNGLGNSVYFDNTARFSRLNPDPTFDVPFRTPYGDVVSGKPTTANNVTTYPILNYFNPSSTNEVTSARVGNDGSGRFDFEAQSSYKAPHLGCGTEAHLRCWLVIVPRGTIFGGDGYECSGIADPDNDYQPYSKGRPNSIQAGSPIDPKCDYWDNRISVPLDFTPTGSTCPPGSGEERVSGSQLMIGAMNSWQPSLCKTTETVFNFSTNPDSIAREQLVETGEQSPSTIYTGFPVSAGELSTQDGRDQLATSTISYAPVAVSGVVVAFYAEFALGRQEKMVLSPRLLAKILTQSYRFTVPYSPSDVAKNAAQLGAVNRKYFRLSDDPEFKALNPNASQFTEAPAIVLPGPGGADAIRQVWRWILADKDAVAFLDGTPDPSGMTVNPYYLPFGQKDGQGNLSAVVPWWLDENNVFHETPVQKPVGLTNLDGTPHKLSESPLDSFPKNDGTLMPFNLNHEKSRFDSIQFSPYSEDLLSAARQTFRADPQAKTFWDDAAVNPAGEQGAWVSSGPQVPGSKFVISITDTASAARYALSTAELLVPNTTTAVKADAEGMTVALKGLRPTSLDSVTQVDPAQVPADGYPLTMVTYAGVNLTKSSQATRFKVSSMLTQVTTTGQEPGTASGQLPPGYVPLSEAMVKQAAASAISIKDYVAPPPTNSSFESGLAQDGSFESGADPAVLGSDPEVAAGTDKANDGRTKSSSTESLARSGLAVSLGVGLAGLLFSPLLFRRRGPI
ncbi:MAG TPA: hypothetical protein VNT53_03100 [Pseudolysinimonas sp.]|nr:hypothetical protein [Pseudolysinimonas sp.]